DVCSSDLVVVGTLGDAVEDDLGIAELVPVEAHPQDAVVLGGGEIDEHEAVVGELGRDGDAEQSPLGACDGRPFDVVCTGAVQARDRKSTRLNSSHVKISYAVFCLKKKNKT